MNLENGFGGKYAEDSTLLVKASFGTLLNTFPICQGMADIFALDAVAQALPQITGAVMKIVPTGSRKGFYVHTWHLDFSENAKFGRFPPNVALKTHLPSFLTRGYETEREPLDLRFHTPESLGHPLL